jgi:hypothetical protein
MGNAFSGGRTKDSKPVIGYLAREQEEEIKEED